VVAENSFYRSSDRALVRYRSPDEDSARWVGFRFREGDIVISTRSKTGTTWVQMICALLVFRTPELPQELSALSPWLDWLITPREEVLEQLAAQEHRRFIKTHTPLDGVPADKRATYIVTGRHPLDSAVSLYHQGQNIDRVRLRRLTGAPEPTEASPAPRPLREWLMRWIEHEDDPVEQPDSLRGVFHHLRVAWERRDEQNILLVHYDDLSSDLASEMARIAGRLQIEIPAKTWPTLVEAATFGHMRSIAKQTVPDPSGILKEKIAFFRRGTSGAGRELLSTEEYGAYLERVAGLAPPDLVSWLHGDT
jgi:aryl sulfotransferase